MSIYLFYSWIFAISLCQITDFHKYAVQPVPIQVLLQRTSFILQKAFTNLLYLPCYTFQWKGDCLTGALWIMAYKFLITVAVKPPWCLSEK